MTPTAWYGLVLCLISVAAAYRIGFAAGYEQGHNSGLDEGRREGAREGSRRGFAVGFDRGRRRAEEGDSESDATTGWRLNRFAVGLIGVLLAIPVIWSMIGKGGGQTDEQPASRRERGGPPSVERIP